MVADFCHLVVFPRETTIIIVFSPRKNEGEKRRLSSFRQRKNDNYRPFAPEITGENTIYSFSCFAPEITKQRDDRNQPSYIPIYTEYKYVYI